MIRIYASYTLEIDPQELINAGIPLDDINAIRDYMNDEGGGEENYQDHGNEFYFI